MQINLNKNITLYNADNIEILKFLPDESIDMILTSPPYDNLRKYSLKNKKEIEKLWNFDKFKLIAKELTRILKQGRVIIWIVNDATINCSETGTSFKQALYFMELGLKLHDTMIFKKVNPIPQIYRKRYNNEFEYMFVFSKGCVKIHNPITVKTKHNGLKLKNSTYKNFSPDKQKRKKKAKPVKEYKIKGNIWEYVVGVNKIDKEAKRHPAPFPYQLAYDHIISWSNKGDIILDPFMGSGTTGIACIDTDRKFIGIEISKEYCEIAKNRMLKNIKNKN